MNSSDNPPRFPGRIGLGTSSFGETAANHDKELAAVRHALDVGYRVIDTAEWYGHGGAERIIGSALAGFGAARRSELFIISKIRPEKGAQDGTVRTCEDTLRNLGCEYLDLYHLHWRKPEFSFDDTLRAFDELLARGLVRNIGVSNFDVDDFEEWQAAEKRVGIRSTAKVNQIGYRPDRRGIEFGLLEWQQARGIKTIAYAPLGEGHMAQHPVMVEIGRERGVSGAQIAIAWTLRVPDIAVALCRSVTPAKIEDNLRATAVTLTAAELARIDRAFPVKYRWLRQSKLLRGARSAVRRLRRG